MLYDPKWEKKINSSPQSIPALIAWLEAQPCNGSYDFIDPSNCLLAQYLKYHGRALGEYRLSSEDAAAFFGDGGFIIHGNHGMKGGAATGSWTFGAALERANGAHLYCVTGKIHERSCNPIREAKGDQRQGQEGAAGGWRRGDRSGEPRRD